jgi:NADP-dependent 3-hydroxy acid dehydrogenase YdfG
VIWNWLKALLRPDFVIEFGHVTELHDDQAYNKYCRSKDWQSQFNSNTFGAINVSRAFLPHFRANKAGTIVFIGSAAALCGMPTLSLYCASKWDLTGAF